MVEQLFNNRLECYSKMALIFEEFWSLQFLGNTLADYSIALVFFFAALLILKIFKFVIVKKLESLSKKTKNTLDDVIVGAIDSIGWPFYFLVSLYIAVQYIDVLKVIDSVLYYLLIIIITFYAARLVQKLIVLSAEFVAKKQGDKDAEAPAIMMFIGRFVQGIIWIIVIILMLDNLGYKISTLLAGVGIGGIAIAFALQNVLSDLFASVSIYFDKPFKVGDYIVIGSDNGTVEKIGMKSTRIKTLQGQELIISNKELTESRINNFKKMKKRRVVFQFGVTYDTKSSTLKKIPKMIKEIIKNIDKADIDRVHFKEFADSSLLFEVVYYVTNQDYTQYMNIQQKVNYAIKTAFDKEHIEMAFPTQTIYVKK